MHRSNVLVAQFFLLLIVLCLASSKIYANSRTIYLVSTGWHIGIVVPVDSVLKRNLPETINFPNANFLEIGWGDKNFYQATNPSLPIAFNALLKSTSSVIHVYGFSKTVELVFENAEIIKLTLEEEHYSSLLSFIHKSFTRNANGSARIEGSGLYGPKISRFYTANGKFHVFNTCNTWVANAIHLAGIDIDPQSIITADSLMSAVRNTLQDK